MAKSTSAAGSRRATPKQPAGEAHWAKVAAWLFPFAAFLVYRLFSSDPYFLLAGDQCAFLELGRTFPRHELYNHGLYLIHPPLFGYAIGIFQLFLPLLTAGLAATLFFASINFFVTRRICLEEDVSAPAMLMALTYLAANRAAVAYDYHVARVSILVCGTALAIWAFGRMLLRPTRHTLITAAVCNVFCLWISDHAAIRVTRSHSGHTQPFGSDPSIVIDLRDRFAISAG